MVSVVVCGHVTKDLDFKTSAKKTEYAVFSVAENLGFGENKRANFYRCVGFDKVCKNLKNAKVNKGSHVRISGDQEIKEYEKTDGNGNPTGEKRTYVEIIVTSWSYLGGGKKTEPSDAAQATAPTEAEPVDSGDPLDGIPTDLADDDFPF